MCTSVNFIKLVMFYMGVPYRHTLHNQILNSPINSNLQGEFTMQTIRDKMVF